MVGRRARPAMGYVMPTPPSVVPAGAARAAARHRRPDGWPSPYGWLRHGTESPDRAVGYRSGGDRRSAGGALSRWSCRPAGTCQKSARGIPGAERAVGGIRAPLATAGSAGPDWTPRPRRTLRPLRPASADRCSIVRIAMAPCSRAMRAPRSSTIARLRRCIDEMVRSSVASSASMGAPQLGQPVAVSAVAPHVEHGYVPTRPPVGVYTEGCRSSALGR